MKEDCRKRVNNLKAKSYQKNKRMVSKKNPSKRTFFQRVEQENLEKKEKIDSIQIIENKISMGQKGRPKMSCCPHCS